MSGYFLYHSIGCFEGKEAAMATALSRFATGWSAMDDGQWPSALALQGDFLDRWARVIGAAPGCLAQAESVTGALYSVLRGLPQGYLRGGKVLIAADCFPSLHFLLAEAVARMGGTLVTVAAEPGRGYVADDRMLDAWDGDVRLAVLTWVTSTASHRSDVARLVAHGRAMGSLVGVDITQGVGIRPYDVEAVGADFSVGSSLKWLCGVSGAAVLHARPALIELCQPEFRGWFSQENPFNWDLDGFALAPDARRFGNGTPSVLPAVASLCGLDYVLGRGVEALAAENAALTGRLVAAVQEAGLELVSPAGAEARGGSVMLRLPERIAAGALVDELRAAGLFTDARGQVLRLSPGNVTTADDCDRLGAELARRVTGRAPA